MDNASLSGSSDSFRQIIENPNFNLLADVLLRVSVEVGSTTMRLGDAINLTEGSIVELNRQVGDLLDIFANGTAIARGEVVAADGRYGIRVLEITDGENRPTHFERRQ